jgi:hypothetical protein
MGLVARGCYPSAPLPYVRPSGAPYFPEASAPLISGGRIRKLPLTAQRRMVRGVAPTLMGLTGKPFRAFHG